ncbi:MAG TPA: DnaA regulatory inactivator Hda [Halothiobacillaceae bacterium]|nr:DnaA regulatory inactivator Hda [Halothiobacillaceae bacterium]
MQQIPLALGLHIPATLTGFAGEQNALLCDLIAAQTGGQGEAQLYLHAPEQMGKSHLAQAACYLAGEQGVPAAYWPLRQLGGQLADASERIDAFGLAVVDDVDAIVGIAEQEYMLFDLINRCREQQTPLLLTAKAPPNALALRLPDLQSRLNWGVVLPVADPTDDEKIALLTERARDRGLVLPANTAQWLLAHRPRSVGLLLQDLERLDQAAVTAQRHLTIPFVRQILG